MKNNDIVIVPAENVTIKRKHGTAKAADTEIILSNVEDGAVCGGIGKWTIDGNEASFRVQVDDISSRGTVSGRVLAVKDKDGNIGRVSGESYNENCLENIRCPHCGSLGPFTIAITRKVIVADNGIEDDAGDSEWDELSYCECRNCKESGVVADFRKTQKHSEEW